MEKLMETPDYFLQIPYLDDEILLRFLALINLMT